MKRYIEENMTINQYTVAEGTKGFVGADLKVKISTPLLVNHKKHQNTFRSKTPNFKRNNRGECVYA